MSATEKKEPLLSLKSPTREEVEEIEIRRYRQYLTRKGWLRSAVEKRPVDAEGNPLPWYTYSCTHFLERHIQKGMHVFEYGSGYSTLWWAQRVASVTSCEHDKTFFDEILPLAPANVTYLYRDVTVDDRYSTAVKEQKRKFDIVIIDGHSRVACGNSAPDGLTPNGIIIWDNSNLRRDSEGYKHLESCGFRRLDFYGNGPILAREWATAIFYRDGNCLRI